MDPNSPWGMVTHSPQEPDFKELAAGGVAWIRLDFPWKLLQESSSATLGTGPLWTYYEDAVKRAKSYGLWILGGLGSTPQWAIDPDRYRLDNISAIDYMPEAYPPKDLSLWNAYVNAVVARYGSSVRHWGIWNEPDSRNETKNVCFWRGTMEEFYRDIVKRAVDVIGSRGMICAGDFAKADAPVPKPGLPHWIRNMLTTAGRSLHALTIHVYRGDGFGSDVINGAKVARGLIDDYNARNGTRIELWITETGWYRPKHNDEGIGVRTQSLCKAVRQNPWVKKIFPYVWSTYAADPFNFKDAAGKPREQWSWYRGGIQGF